MKAKRKTTQLAIGAIISCLYVVLTFLASALGLSSGVIQLRFSEALTILPRHLKAAVPALFAGCILANLLTGCAFWDIIFGSLATLLGGIGTYTLRKYRILSLLPPIIANTLIVPPVLIYVYGVEDAVWFIYLTVFIGEVISCGIFGYILNRFAEKYNLSGIIK